MEETTVIDFDELFNKKPSQEVETEPVEEQVETKEDTETEEVEEEEIPVTDPVEEVTLDKAKQLYDIVSEVLPLDENESPTVEWLQEQIDTAPQKMLETAISALPVAAQSVLDYVINKHDFTVEDLKAYIKALEVPEVTVNTVEGAKEYLKTNATFTKLYDDADELEEALDALEDNGKLLAKAKKLYDADVDAKNQEASKMTEAAKAEKIKLEKESKEFFENIKKEVEQLDWKQNAKDSVYQNLQSKRIQEVQKGIQSSPKATMQLARIYSYFENGSFDKLFDELKLKQNSKENQAKVENLQKSKLTGLLGNGQPEQKNTSKGWRPEY